MGDGGAELSSATRMADSPRFAAKHLTVETIVMISRRAFLSSAAFGGSLAATGLGGKYLAVSSSTGDFILEHRPISIPNLPRAFDGYKIGFITDLHLSVWVPEEWIIRAIDAVTANDVDLLILGGDYILVNESSLWQNLDIVRDERFASLNKRDAIPQIYSTVAECFRGRVFRDGILGVVGNHDRWNSFPTFQSIFNRAPYIKILINEEVTLSRGESSIRIFGADDYLTGIPSTPPPLPSDQPDAVRIIVSHNPDYIATLLSAPENRFSFAMCGHTHGGQIVLPVLGPIAAQVVDERFIVGQQNLKSSTVYTSRGLGVVGLPFRYNCPAEVTIFTLRRP
jgi:predicted MPP superfamily phosphohydrolase